MDRFYWKRLGCHAASALLHQSCRALYGAKPTAVTLAPLSPKDGMFVVSLLGKKREQAFLELVFGLFLEKKRRFYVKVRYSDTLSNQGMHA